MRRLSRIFGRDGKTVIVAIDHGMGLSVNPALDDMAPILNAVVAGGADAVLTTYGIASRFQKELESVGLILRMDGGGSSLGAGKEGPRLLYSVEDALRIGADAIACMGFPGAPFEHDTMQNVALLASEGRAWGLPVMAEMLPGGFSGAIPNSVENLVLSARTGCEYGASIIKTAFAGSTEEYRKVIRASYQPVVVLGGEKTAEPNALFECIEMAIAAGAQGVAIGRNVWRSEDPEGMTRTLVELVHGGKKASQIKR